MVILLLPGHIRQERPFRPGPDMIHPALRERGRAIPTVNIPRRTIEREARVRFFKNHLRVKLVPWNIPSFEKIACLII